MKLSGNDKKILETLFEMGGGYVLDFSDRRMKDFFYDEFEIDIYDAKYDLDFPSKSTANRLRGIWLVESGETVGKIILSLVEYLETTLLVDAKEVSSHTKDLILKARQIGAKLQFPDFAKDYEPFIKMITKKEIFATLGSDLILKDRKLFISWDKLLFPIKSMALEVREIKERLEPAKKPIDAKDMGEIYSHNPRLLRDLDSVTGLSLLAQPATPPRAVALRLSHPISTSTDASLEGTLCLLANHCWSAWTKLELLS